VQISAKEFSSKYNSKYEIYRFLTVDCKYYLSPYNTVSIYFLKDIASGSKKRTANFYHNCNSIDVKCSAVKHLYAPLYESLSIAAILNETKKNPPVMRYLPDDKDLPRLPRQYILNLIYTVVGAEFEQWVHHHIQERNQNRAEEK